MSSLPYQKIYWQDLLTDVMPLNNAQLGAYVRLLAANWVNHGLPPEKDAIADMANLSAKDFNRLWRFLQSKLVHLPDGQVSIRRTEEDLQKAAKVSEAARKAVESRHRGGATSTTNDTTGVGSSEGASAG